MAEPESALPALPRAGRYRLDPKHTFAQFAVRHLVVGRVDGRFDSLAGEFVVVDDADRLFEGIDVRIDAASIDTNVQARDEDLRSGRFFDVASFPELTFQSSGSWRQAENVWAIIGELTIRAVTRQVSLEAAVRGTTIDPRGKTRIGLTARTALARTDFDLTTELAQESGPDGGLDIEVRVDVEAIREDSAI